LLSPAQKGSVFYISTGFGQMIEKLGHGDYVTLLDTMLQHGAAKPPMLTSNAPGSVDVTLARWQRGQVVQLVNSTGPAPLDAVIPLGPIETEIAWEGPATVELVIPGAAGQLLTAERKDGRLRFTIPRLDAYAQVVIRG
jgi:hypothetical protein